MDRLSNFLCGELPIRAEAVTKLDRSLGLSLGLPEPEVSSVDFSSTIFRGEELDGRTMLVNAGETMPWIRHTYSQFEREFLIEPYLVLASHFYWLAPAAIFLYLLLTFCGQRYMRDRKPYDLRVALKWWNFSLALFSLCGTIRIWTQLAYCVYYLGFERVFTTPATFTYGLRATGVWIILFNLSKYVELLDTAFIVLRKKPLEFLHWYHHATVLFYTWDGFVIQQPIGIWFVAMNYAVHTVMYFYYFVTAHRKKKPRWAILVTALQLAQMGGGILFTLITLYYSTKYTFSPEWTINDAAKPNGRHFITTYNIYLAILMYSTYLYLFALYFIQRYTRKQQNNQKKFT